MTSSWIFGILVFIYICRILVYCLVFSCTTHPYGFSWLDYCNDGFYAYFLMYVHCVHGIIPTQLCMTKLFWTKLIEFKSHRLYSLAGFSELPFPPSRVNTMLFALKFNFCRTSPGHTRLVLINTMFAGVMSTVSQVSTSSSADTTLICVYMFFTKHDDIIKTFSIFCATGPKTNARRHQKIHFKSEKSVNIVSIFRKVRSCWFRSQISLQCFRYM